MGEPRMVAPSPPARTTWAGGGLLQFDYRYDLGGRIDRITETIGGASPTTRDYHYDLRGRLTDVTVGGTTQYHFGYDDNGNRTSWTTPITTCTTGCTAVDAQDRLLRHGSTVFTYDEAGALASRTEGSALTSYDYDELGHLRRVDLPSGVVLRYLIDGLGRRAGRYVGTDVTMGDPDRFWLYQDALNPVAQLDGSGNLELLFVYASQPHVPDVVVDVSATPDAYYRVVTDHLGSVRRLVNADTGAVAASYDYGPFGELQTGAPTVGSLAERFPFRFAGGLWDQDTGLIRFGARDYDPRLGRWTAKDPILWGGGQANLYEYVGSSPLEHIDLTGQHPILYYLLFGLAIGAGSDAGGEENGNLGLVALPVLGATTTPLTASYAFAFLGVSSDQAGDENGNPAALLGSLAGIGVSATVPCRPYTPSELRAIRSLQRNIAEHKQKLDAYRSNPFAHDNRGILAANAARPDVQQRIIDSRIRHLETEIRAFQGAIDRIRKSRK